MNYLLPTEQLSPTQLQALTCLQSGNTIEIRSSSIDGLIELLNLSVNVKGVSICCNPHTLRLLHDYKERHSILELTEPKSDLSEAYSLAITRIRNKYKYCYPANEASIRHQYHSLLKFHDHSINHLIDLDPRLKGTALSFSGELSALSDLLFTYRRTWGKYTDIDPLQTHYYISPINEYFESDLDEWIKAVRSISADMQKGLNEIVDEEKNRILITKKQLSQHLVNYQHSRSDTELSYMRLKLGFLMADLPKNRFTELPELVMYAVSNWDNVTSRYLARYSRRFNSRNHQSVLIYEAMQELRAVLRDIDENGCIKVDISNNPLSYETQIIRVEVLLKQLRYCKYWITDETEYVVWRRFYAAITEEDKPLVDALMSLDKSNLHDQLKYIEIQRWRDQMMNKGILTLDDSLNVFEAYKEFNAIVDWSAVDLTPIGTSGGDYEVTFDGIDYILNSINGSGQSRTVTLYDKALDNIKPAITLDYYNQSKQANHLARAMIASNTRLKTYQTKSLNIISCLDDRDTVELFRLLADSKINELKGESVSDLIKGSILDEGKEKILIVYDGLLNVELTEHYIWQRLVVQSMSIAGYKVISINTEDALNHLDLSKHLSTYLPSEIEFSVKSTL